MSEEKETEQGSMGAAAHKSSGLAVPNEALFEADEQREWLVALLPHQKWTKACCVYLAEQPATCAARVYVPCRGEWHVYPNRTRRVVTRYVIPNVVFVAGLPEAEAYRLVSHCPYIRLFLPDRARSRVDGRVALASVSELEVRRLRAAIQSVESLDDIEIVPERLVVGAEIEVVEGQLAGMSGNYYTRGRKDYLVFAVGKLGNMVVRIDRRQCRMKKPS